MGQESDSLLRVSQGCKQCVSHAVFSSEGSAWEESTSELTQLVGGMNLQLCDLSALASHGLLAGGQHQVLQGAQFPATWPPLRQLHTISCFFKASRKVALASVC